MFKFLKLTALVLLLLQIVLCTSEPTSPINEYDPGFIPSQIIIDTKGSSLTSGDTIHSDSATLSIKGNTSESRFQIRIDSADWDTWQKEGTFHYDSLKDGTHQIFIKTKYLSGTRIDSSTITFYVQAEGYKPFYNLKGDSTIIIDSGSSIIITAPAQGAQPLSYIWTKNNVPLSIIAGDTLKLSNVIYEDSGIYRCIVNNNFGKDISRAYTIRIVNAPTISHSFSYDGNGFTRGNIPTGTKNYKPNETVIIRSNTGALSKDGFTFAGWNNLADGSGKRYSAADTLIMNSQDIKLYAEWKLEPPVIIVEPQEQTVMAGTVAIFTITAFGANLDYHWQKNGKNITNAVFPSCTTSITAIADSGSTYNCVVVNAAGEVKSDTVKLLVRTVLIAPVIKADPSLQSVVEGMPATFLVVASGTNPLYQWQKNTIDISNATAASYIINSTTLDQNGSTYRCIVTNEAGKDTSASALLEVNKFIIPPKIETSPQNQSVTEGSRVKFFVVASGTDLTYQWQKNNVNLTNKISDSLIIDSTTLDNNGSTYRCIVTNSAGQVISAAASLIVSKLIQAPKIITQPLSQTVVEGSKAKFEVIVSGTNPSYQWQRDTVNIPGATTTTFIIDTAKMNINNTSYRCIVSNSAGKDISTGAVLTVKPLPEVPSITLITTGDKTATLRWDSVTGATAYNLYYRAGTTVEKINTSKISNVTSPYTVKNLDNGTQYAFAICSENENGESALSNVVTATPRVYTITTSITGAGGTINPSGTVRIIENSDTTFRFSPQAGYLIDSVFIDGIAVLKAKTDSQYIFKAVRSDHSVRVRFATMKFNVRFDSQNGGIPGNSPPPQTVNYGDKVSKPIIDPTKTGYTFVGWFKDTAGTTGNHWNFDKEIVTKDIIIYAKWNINQYTVKFNSESGTAVDSQQVNYGDKLTKPANPTRPNYIFADWYKDSSLINIWDFAKDTVTNNDILFAKWNVAAPKITIEPENDTVIERYRASFTITASGINLTYIWQKGPSYEPITNATSATYTIAETKQSDNESYRCVVINDGGSDTSISVTLTVKPLPGVPSIKTITAGDSTVTVSWVNDTGITSYNLYYRAGATVDKSNGIKTENVTSPFIITKLLNGTQYAFAVSAVNAAGESDLSTILTTTPQVPVPVAPTISTITAGDAKANVTWSTVTDATSYNLYYAAGTTVDKSGIKIAGALTPKDITGLTNGILYAFAVSAENAAGESDLSTVQTAIPQAPAPGTPSIRVVIAGDAKARVIWRTVTDATSYNVYYAAGTTVDKSGTKITGAVSPKDITGLTNGKQYTFAVSAVRAGSESNLSSVFTVTPKATDTSLLIK